MIWTREKALHYHNKIVAAAETLPDEQAIESVELFETWNNLLKKGEGVPVKKRCQDASILYECIQAHTPQADWRPADTPALWKRVSVEEWPEIPENIPSTSPWMAGDKGTWKGQHYICVLDNTVWNPDVYPAAWELQP